MKARKGKKPSARREIRDMAAQHARKRAEDAALQPMPSPTAVAAEAQLTGIVPLAAEDARTGISKTELTARLDQRSLDVDDVGDQGPGGSMLNPELNRVDDIGRAAGVQEEDSGELRTSSEILDRRDRRRALLEKPDPHE